MQTVTSKRSALLILALIRATTCPAADEPSAVSSELTAKLDTLVPELMDTHHTPGVSMVLIEHREIVWQKAWGDRAAGGDEPVDTETVFEACSMSKPVFAFAVMRLVEQQKLDLDRPLSEYLQKPYLPDEPLQQKITARMVLTHTSGLPNWRAGGWSAGGPLHVEFEPGTKFNYSGEGFWYLQQVVEELIGEKMSPWIDRTVLQPLEMTHSSYVWRDAFNHTAAAGHDAEGHVKEDRPHYGRENAAFTLYTTPTDYARFLIGVMPGDDALASLLTGDSLQAMLTPTVDTGVADVWRGLGWALVKTDSGVVASHSGSNGTGFRCYCRFSPRRWFGSRHHDQRRRRQGALGESRRYDRLS